MPKVFGWQHLVYLIITVLASVVGLIFIGRIKNQKLRTCAINLSAAVLLLLIAWNRISIAMVAEDAWQLIPGSFCGVTSVLLAVFTLLIKNKNHPIFHCIIYVAFIGVLAVVYPDFLGQNPSFLHSRTISGMLHHSMSIFVALAIMLYGGFEPSPKRWYCLPLGLCVYITYGLLLLQTLEYGNPMLIQKPILANTPLTWYVLGALFVALQFISVLIYHLIKQRKSSAK